MTRKEIIQKVLAEACRLLLGLVFFFSGATKAVDPVGVGIKIEDYLTAFGLGSLRPLALIAAFNLCAIELMLSVGMLTGVYRKFTSLLLLLMMIFLTPLTFYLAIFNPVSDCGCFGEALVLTNWQTFGKNVILLAAAIYVCIHHKLLTPLYTFHAYWFVALWGYVFGIYFSYHNYVHLPMLDFRPYKIGANIPALMSIPEGAEEDVYEYAFIYEKDGVRQTFSLEEVPADDSTWVYVDSEIKLVKQGYVPPVTDFHLYDIVGNDVTDELLAEPRGTFLLIAPKLEDADDTFVEELSSVYDYASNNEMPFYCVTGSSEEAIETWSEDTGAEYPYLLADDVQLKTMIRSNPGLMLLREGTILMKWHVRDIPKEEELSEAIADCMDGKTDPKDEEEGRFISNVFTFILPLLLVWGYDFLYNRQRPKRKEGED